MTAVQGLLDLLRRLLAPTVSSPPEDDPPAPPGERPTLSGRYGYGQLPEREPGQGIRGPSIGSVRPVFAPELPQGEPELHFVLHVDVDGVDALNVVSGALGVSTAPPPARFIGRVTSRAERVDRVELVVEDFRVDWPIGSPQIDRLELTLRWPGAPPCVDAVFVDTARGVRRGPYRAPRRSPFFREVEIEVDREDEAAPVEPYRTHAHPDRPDDLADEELTLEAAFARAGIRVRRSLESNVIATAAAGTDRRWSDQELHDAMEEHWSAFANRPQWKLWLFLAELAVEDGLGGIMFDGDIDEPGGVDRQGTAVFTRSPHFHDPSGAYPQANPPAAAAARRELFFNTVHEAGHAFNLAHSFQKQLQQGSAWAPPPWMPLTTDERALSWMNYPDQPSPGANASWFYRRFRFRFDDVENLFLRHAPESFVRHGDVAWFTHHGRVARTSLDRRLELVARTQKPELELGEPVFIELRLRNVGERSVEVDPLLDVAADRVEIAITDPRGARRPFLPVQLRLARRAAQVLMPDERIYRSVHLSVGRLGCPFKEPGPYTIEASYHNPRGGAAAAALRIFVKPAASPEDFRSVYELFGARVARVLQLGGSRAMEEENERIDWVRRRLGEGHPTRLYLSATRALPLATRYKRLGADDRAVRVEPPDPEAVVRTLDPVVHATSSAADSLGNITYREVVETYATSAERMGKPQVASAPLKALVHEFRARKVIPSVIERLERRIRELE
ncbi:MAG: hypothetical protein ACFCGT_11980 [Sandaracinaceae bacterium]